MDIRAGITPFLVIAFLTGCDPADRPNGTVSNDKSYWEVPAYDKIPPAGPGKAKGIIYQRHNLLEPWRIG